MWKQLAPLPPLLHRNLHVQANVKLEQSNGSHCSGLHLVGQTVVAQLVAGHSLVAHIVVGHMLAALKVVGHIVVASHSNGPRCSGPHIPNRQVCVGATQVYGARQATPSLRAQWTARADTC